MRTPTWRARLIIIAVLVLANGYSGIVAATLLFGPRAVAQLDRCGSGKHYTCSGHWSVAGVADDGTVAGATRGDLHDGTGVAIRTGLLGAYSDRPDVLLVRVLPALVVDAGFGLGFVLIGRYRRRMRSDVQSLRDEPGAVELLRSKDGTVLDRDGRPRLAPGPTPGEVVDGSGRLVLRIDRTDPGTGEPVRRVADAAGRPLGTVARGHEQSTVCFDLRVADGTLVATARTTGGAYAVTARDGTRLARFGWDGGRAWVLRLDVPVREPVRTLIVVLGLEVHGMIGVRPLSRRTAAFGRGYGPD